MAGSKHRWRTAVLAFSGLCLTVNLWAASETILHNFGRTGDGTVPLATLIADTNGNFYGTTFDGGSRNAGIVFKTSPNGSGGWTTTVLHNFGAGTDGVGPCASLTMDSSGNLYGTTLDGGGHNAGTIFETSPNGSGGWTTRVLHNFGETDTDGMQPYAGLVMDGSGNLYGTTFFGGSNAVGTVFELTPDGNGSWTEKIIHDFKNSSTDGFGPSSNLIFHSGQLYGTTAYGGPNNSGTVFYVSPCGTCKSGWAENLRWSFNLNGPDGAVSVSTVTIDDSRNIYGTVNRGGANGGGTVFELSPVNGQWTETILRSLGNGTDAAIPLAGVLLIDGNVYGTTASGGANNQGTVFELTPSSGGHWIQNILHSFGGGNDGIAPYAGLISDSQGNLYCTTSAGGSHSQGTALEVMP